MDINITAPINQLGYGIVGLNITLAFERLGHTPALWFLGNVEAPIQCHDTLRAIVQRTAFYNPKAPSLRIWHQFDLAQHVGRGPHCAYPFFELTRLKKAEVHHLAAQDIVFAPCHWAGEVMVANGVPEDRVRYAPPGVDQSIFRPVEHVEPGTTTFVNIGKWEVRKGHDILIEAFEKAFTPTDNVRLVMNCFNPCFRTKEELERYNDQWVSLYKNSRLGDKVFVYEQRLPTQRDVALLMASADCGVFPSRAEGWNLEAAEMLAMGKHVILTNYSGHTEFANESNARLIHIDRLEDAHDGVWFDAKSPHWDGKPGHWAELGERQVDQLVEHMRSIHRLKQEGQLKVNTAGIETMKRFTWENTAAKMVAVFEG